MVQTIAVEPPRLQSIRSRNLSAFLMGGSSASLDIVGGGAAAAAAEAGELAGQLVGLGPSTQQNFPGFHSVSYALQGRQRAVGDSEISAASDGDDD